MGRGKPRKTNMKGSAGINKQASIAYLKKNKTKEGVITQGSGLQYEILEKGDGAFVEYGSMITVDHCVSLVDGTIIDDTRASGEPETFALKDTIKGYHEGLLLMSVGDRFKFSIPHELAWNKKGSSQVGPFSTIIIDCTVLAVEPKE